MGAKISGPGLITRGLSKSPIEAPQQPRTGRAHPREMLEKNRRTPSSSPSPSRTLQLAQPLPSNRTFVNAEPGLLCAAAPAPSPQRLDSGLPADLFFLPISPSYAEPITAPPERRGTALAGPRRAASFLLFFLIEFLGWGERVRELHLGET